MAIRGGKVEICGVNTSELKVLSAKEKEELLKKAAEGRQKSQRRTDIRQFKARAQCDTAFFRTRRKSGRPVSGRLYRSYQGNRQFRLIARRKIQHLWPWPMIIGELRRYLRDNTPIRVSRSVRDLAYKALSVKDELSAKLSREPKIEEIAAKLGVPKEDVALALDAIARPGFTL